MLAVWGKWDGSHTPLPLLAHLLDTGVIAEMLFSDLAVAQRRILTKLLDPDDTGRARARFAYLAALHDLGKADPLFQGQQWSRRSAEFHSHLETLKAEGFPVDPPKPKRPELGETQRHYFRHEWLTAQILLRDSQLPAWARLAVAGHHGRYPYTGHVNPPPEAVSHLEETLNHPAWKTIHHRLILEVAGAFNPDDRDENWPTGLGRGDLALLPVLTGLICLADWMASDESFVNLVPDLTNGVTGYVGVRREQAVERFSSLWDSPAHPTGTFSEIFSGIYPNRPIQAWAVGHRHESGLCIVMVPTGEGKTETALWMHASGRHQSDGLLFALPTTATADAMFDRVRGFFESTSSIGHLAHSRAWLNAFYSPSAVRPIDTSGYGDNEGLRPDDWFSGRHRGLLAPVTVATCDQVLAAAVDHKYIQVRMAALAGKHVILDEVHTYDAYQHELLKRLLGWLGSFRVRTTLLSATIPTARLHDYVRAWRDGWEIEVRDKERMPIDLDSILTGIYPAVLRVDDQVEVTQIPSSRQYHLTVNCHPVEGDSAAFFDAVLNLIVETRATHPHSQIGVIVNTVDRCISIAEALRAAGHPVDTLHSRMTASQRKRATDAVYEAVGPQPTRSPTIVVATQIAEASLDLDFDILITDLAPMTSLLQRAGRLWRHSTPSSNDWVHRDERAYRMSQPALHVMVALHDGSLARHATAPYSMAELDKTWRLCLESGNRRDIAIPNDVQTLVDDAHVAWDDIRQEGLDDFFEKALQEALGSEAAMQFQAKSVGHDVTDFKPRFDDPNHAHGRLAELTRFTLWNDEAVTRLRDAFQIQLLLFDPTGDNPHVWHGDPHSARFEPDLLKWVMPVTGGLARQLLDRATQPEGKTKASSALRDLTFVALDDIGEVAYLDPDLGLVRRQQRKTL